MHFAKLRLAGFKSFVDPTEFTIEPGVTGIVGPNGCGKSNLVEALRWVMGEHSARTLRGGEMDDVIFGGTGTRPARNVAEVAIELDNAVGDAPAPFAKSAEIDVCRQIERGMGSTYRVNGRETRQRDVQLLFADIATGARSAAIVGQGRIGAVISAKPADRRLLLEEAAGITGLHSRRHEAELRLRAAENNLTRLDDVVAGQDERLRELKRQARQAVRYRNLNEQIRRAEAALLQTRWLAAVGACDTAAEALLSAADGVAALTGAAAAAATIQTDAATALPPLRSADGEAAAQLQRLEVARRQLEDEERRLAGDRARIAYQLAQIAEDLQRETLLADEAQAALARLDSESAALASQAGSQAGAIAGAAAARDQAAEAVARAEDEVTRATAALAADEARQSALARQRADLDLRIGRLQEDIRTLAAERQAVLRDAADAEAQREAEEAAAVGDAEALAARAEADHCQAIRTHAEEAEAEARAEAQAVEASHGRLLAEQRALADLLTEGAAGAGTAVIDLVRVEPGYEAALGAALGDDLAAAVQPDAPRRWTDLPAGLEGPALPAGCQPLARFVQAPAALARRLAQIGVVAAAEGASGQTRLAQGQRLVSRAGGLWRWDGYTVAAGAPGSAEVRLRQKNRLDRLEREIELSATALAAAQARLAARSAERVAAARRDAEARSALRRAEEALHQVQNRLAAVGARVAANAMRLGSVNATLARRQSDLAETTAQRGEADRALAEVGDIPRRRAALEAARQALAGVRETFAAAARAHETAERNAAARRERQAVIGQEIGSWQSRAAGATQRLAALAEREAVARREAAALADRPTALAARRSELFEQLGLAEAARRAANDRLAQAEAALAAADRGARQAEADLAAAREERVRAAGLVEQRVQAREAVAERIHEQIGCTPEGLAEVAGSESGAAGDGADAAEARLTRLLGERERIGPVNLRAEQEASALEHEMRSLQNERADLTAAIERLRRGIGALNREARERLTAAFTAIDGHFQALFARLFGGGRAHLALIEAEDPLEAGLEVMASPPGKKLQSLALLSGGEQALTALALLFAVFKTNPAPICVLDEVDAPLDDANVDRFCSLLDEMATGGTTRFLVVTHHRMTMARADRLFGVTMTEQGVSQLVSVDLRQAEALRVAI